MATSTVLVGLWLAANLPRRPWSIQLAISVLALGWALNVAVMAPNHGMPVSRAALDAVGAADGVDVREGNLYKHVALDDDTTWPWLGDVVAVPPIRTIVSAGDIVMAGGVVLLVGAIVGNGGRRETRGSRLPLAAPSR